MGDRPNHLKSAGGFEMEWSPLPSIQRVGGFKILGAWEKNFFSTGKFLSLALKGGGWE